jgi:hypothetical protein
MIMKNALCFSGVIFLWISTLNYAVSTFYNFGGDESTAKNFVLPSLALVEKIENMWFSKMVEASRFFV